MANMAKVMTLRRYRHSECNFYSGCRSHSGHNYYSGRNCYSGCNYYSGHNSHSGRQQSGLSLIELMIALLLGTLLVAGAVKIFTSNTQAFRLQDQVSSTQENGRLALEIMLHDLRRAGYGAPMGTNGDILGIVGKDGSATTGSFPGLLADSDEVTVVYSAGTDCQGNTTAGGIAYNRYYIAMDNNLPALFCGTVTCVTGATGSTCTPTGIGSGALVRGVESFQVLYGLAPPNATGNGYTAPVRYVKASEAGTFNGVTGTPVVAAVRIALVIRSDGGVNGLKSSGADMTVLDTTIPGATLAAVTGSNGWPVVHRYFSGTAVMRNKAQGVFGGSAPGWSMW
jgi:type IV pilus assembly protein PilW